MAFLKFLARIGSQAIFQLARKSYHSAHSPPNLCLLEVAGIRTRSAPHRYASSSSFRSTQKTELPQQSQKLKTIGFLNAIKSNLRLHDVVNPQVEQTTASNSLILVHDHIPTLLKMELEGGESYWNFIFRFHFCNHVFSMINIPHRSMSLASRWKLNTCGGAKHMSDWSSTCVGMASLQKFALPWSYLRLAPPELRASIFKPVPKAC